MTGPLRLGKSFMLGFFLRYLKDKRRVNWISNQLQNTFKYKGGSVRETTGIWIWSEPYVVEDNGRKISVFIMDTQGCFDQETEMQDNALVFALSTLLSSVMIFNIKRQLSEDILQFLQYFAGFARLADNDKFDEPFQRLVILIRDWEFPDYPHGYYDDNTSISGMNYKKAALDIREDQPRQVKYVHESIKATFEEVLIYLMPHPGKEVAFNSNFEISKADQDFVFHIGEFVPMILKDENILPKKIGGKFITGNQFIKFVEKWAEMFESDVIPECKTIYEATADIHNEMAKSAAIDNYSRKMKEQLKNTEGMSEKDFQLFNRKLIDDCVELFKSFRRLGGPEIEEKYLALIMEEIKSLFETFHEMNLNKLSIKEKNKELEIERARIDFEIKENERKLKEMKEKNMAEIQRIMKEIEENRRKLKEAEAKAARESQEKAQQAALLQQQLNEAVNKPAVVVGGKKKRGFIGRIISSIF